MLMKYANEVLALWYMIMCSYILIDTDDAKVYIAFIGLHVFVMGLYKYMAEREARHGTDKQISGK